MTNSDAIHAADTVNVSRCYNCASGERTFYDTENSYTLVKCRSCGLIYVDKRPDDAVVSEAHRQGVHSGKTELRATGSFSAAKVSRYKPILTDIFGGDLFGKQTWLDVGCGHGEFLLAVVDSHPQLMFARGTEPNMEKQASARSRGLDVSFFELSTHDSKYDVISLLNVWSHLPDPPAFVRQLKDLLNRQGELLVQTGDTASFPAHQHFKPYYLPDHLSFASQEIVCGILERCDFEILAVRKYHCMSLDALSIFKECVKFLHPAYRSGLRYYILWRRYAQTNMYIRARLR